ncbi:MAG: diguanylate cyclase (GGDEF)-like protein [Cognaticolwellia sp.]|jgi:diguanylate cyclase (GGDEF)-like protein
MEKPVLMRRFSQHWQRLSRSSLNTRQVLLQLGWMCGLVTVGAIVSTAILAFHPHQILARAVLLMSGCLGVAMFWGGWALLLWTEVRRGRSMRERSEHVITAIHAIGIGGVLDCQDLGNPDLQTALQQLGGNHQKLIRTLEVERMRSSFAQDLAEALDIADTAREVYEIARRAADVRLSSDTFHLIVDHGESALEWEVSMGERACACPSAKRCPALRKGRLMTFSPGGGLARCAQLLQADTHAVCAPVAVAGKSLAIVQANWDQTPSKASGEACSAMAHALGTRLGVVLSLEEREQQANTDALTGLANRRGMQQLLSDLDEANSPYAVVACDLDHFKKLNDSFGHDVGDRCLCLFAQVLQEVCRASDLACRPGGEEFTLVLPHADEDAALQVGERIRARLLHASHTSGRPFTVSIGISSTVGGTQSPEGLLEMADRALYAAKEDGRDRVVAWNSEIARLVA